MQVSPLTDAPEPGAADAPDRAALPEDQDQSLRAPVLLLLLSSLLWLVAGSLAYVMAFVKLHAPGMMAGAAWLTYGRLHPAATNALLYGFASQAGLAIALWMLARLGRAPLAFPSFAIVGWFVWNLAVPLGIGGILLGDTTGFEWFEMPRYASPALFAAYALIAASALITLAKREEPALYVSQWFLLAALFWFPWVWTVGHLLLAFHPLRGVMQAAVHGWAMNGVATLWLTALSLAIIYYFIPKITGAPLYSRGLAQLGFWTFAICGAWGGLRAGTPLPAWVVSVSVAAGVSMIVPLVANAANWSHTLSGQRNQVMQSLPLQFIVAAAGSYVLTAFLGVLTSARGVSKFTGFTCVATAQHVLLIFGVVGFAVGGAIYYLVPRLAQTEFCCDKAPKIHFYGGLAGLGLATVGLVIGGLVQGAGLSDASKTMIEIIKSTKPWLQLSAAGLLVLTVANGFLAVNFIGVLVKTTRRCVLECVLPELRGSRRQEAQTSMESGLAHAGCCGLEKGLPETALQPEPPRQPPPPALKPAKKRRRK